MTLLEQWHTDEYNDYDTWGPFLINPRMSKEQTKSPGMGAKF